MTAAQSARAQWTVTNLHPVNDGLLQYQASKAYAVRNGLVVGVTRYTFFNTGYNAMRWTNGTPVHLGSGALVDTDSSRDVGYLITPPAPECMAFCTTYYTPGWVLPSASTTVTSLATNTQALGVDGQQVVGTTGNLASMWLNEALTHVSLHPAAATGSAALGVRAGHQVGSAIFSGTTEQACRWTGTAASWVNLHPPGALRSSAHQVDNGTQVGEVWFAGTPHAALWTGTAGSFVDLHPSWATSVGSYARGVSNGIQAGSAFSDRWRATIWKGTADSAQELHSFLPADFTRSYAEGVDVQGSTATVVGYGYNDTTDREEAVMWTTTIVQISQPPVNVIVCSGGSAVFSVGVTAGSSTPTYRWRRNGVDLADDARISGSDTPMLTITGVGSGDLGSYDCIVSDAIIALDSANATLSLATATASRTPSGRICPGGSVTFSLSSSLPSAPTAYQWRRNGVPINIGTNPSAATASLGIASAATADAGTYDCLVTVSCGVIDSGDISLPIGNVQQPPSDQVGCAGGSASFTVLLDQDRPGKQWLKNGNAIVGNSSATTTTLVLNNLSALDVATYSFRYNGNGGCGTVTTNGATLTLGSGPAIDISPAPAQTCPGGAASFSVTPLGAGPFAYSWRKGTVPINITTNPSSATATLMLAGVSSADVGSYDCVVSTSCGSTPSTAAMLTICAADFDCSGIVSIDDIFSFLNAWFAQDPRANIDGAGGVAIDDIFAYLNLWFSGC